MKSNSILSQNNKNIVDSLHFKSFFIDLHNDLLENSVRSNYNWGIRHTIKHTDIPRLFDGGIDAQIFAIWVSPKGGNYYERALNQINNFNKQISLNSDKIAQGRNADNIKQLNEQHKIAAILGVEGGHTIENNLVNLKNFYKLGVRYLTITWENSTDWATSAKDKKSKMKGLSDFGKQVIKTMDSLGMIIDVSHTGIKTIEDILATTKNPIIASHTACYNVRPHYRNLTDEQIKAIASKGGIIGITFYPPFLSNTGTANVETVVKHIDYIVKLVGIDYVAIGSDFDGIEKTPQGLEDVSRFPNLTKALFKKGYSESDIRKILGENFLRVFRVVCKK
jgi:membrane dipeptidase